MATKKKKRVVKSSRSSRKTSSEKAMEKNFPTASSSSYLNLLYGILSVFILFILVFTGIKFFLPKPEQHGEITKEAAQTSKTQELASATPTSSLEAAKGGNVYIVQEGDSLWSISEKLYKSGYNWVSLAEVNKIMDPGVLYKGTKLVVPSVTPILVKNEVLQTQNEGKISQTVLSQGKRITGNSYVIQKGDDLWNISERAYNDGYKWTEIAKANGFTDPNLIHSGNSIKIPR